MLSSDTLKPNSNYLLLGPFWLFKLWLNATFEHVLAVKKPDDNDDTIKHVNIKDIRLALMTPNNSALTMQIGLTKYLLLFSKYYKLSPTTTTSY